MPKKKEPAEKVFSELNRCNDIMQLVPARIMKQNIAPLIKKGKLMRHPDLQMWEYRAIARGIFAKEIGRIYAVGKDLEPALHILQRILPFPDSQRNLLLHCGTPTTAQRNTPYNYCKSRNGGIIQWSDFSVEDGPYNVLRYHRFSMAKIMGSLRRNHLKKYPHTFHLKTVIANMMDKGSIEDALTNLVEIAAAAFFCPLCSPLMFLMDKPDLTHFVYGSINILLDSKRSHISNIKQSECDVTLVTRLINKAATDMLIPSEEDMESFKREVEKRVLLNEELPFLVEGNPVFEDPEGETCEGEEGSSSSEEEL